MDAISFNGWGNLSGESAWSFGVYHEDQARPLSNEHPLQEFLVQAADLVTSNKDQGVVCGRPVRIDHSSNGQRRLSLVTIWANVTLQKRPQKEGLFLRIELPFGESLAGSF